MIKIIRLTFICFLLLTQTAFANSTQRQFSDFLKGVYHDARAAGVSKRTLNKYLEHMRPPRPRHQSPVVRKHDHEAQNVLSYQAYLQRLIPASKIKMSRHEYKKHERLLKAIQEKYGVQGQYLIALWGAESNFGRDTGHFPLVRSLAVLTFYHPRRYYRRQLIAALIMLDRPKVIPEQLKGAFDGGMGQPQFEPETYLSYAVDWDGNGFKNIWTSIPDSLASIAFFLKSNGWRPNQPWGIQVKLPKNFPRKLAGMHHATNITYWKSLHVVTASGRPLPKLSGKTAIIIPAAKNSPSYLVFPNFKVLLRWNDTVFESMAIGLLADATVSKSV